MSFNMLQLRDNTLLIPNGEFRCRIIKQDRDNNRWKTARWWVSDASQSGPTCWEQSAQRTPEPFASAPGRDDPLGERDYPGLDQVCPSPSSSQPLCPDSQSSVPPPSGPGLLTLTVLAPPHQQTTGRRSWGGHVKSVNVSMVTVRWM